MYQLALDSVLRSRKRERYKLIFFPCSRSQKRCTTRLPSSRSPHDPWYLSCRDTVTCTSHMAGKREWMSEKLCFFRSRTRFPISAPLATNHKATHFSRRLRDAFFVFCFLFKMAMAPAEYWSFRSYKSGGETPGTSSVCRGA